MPQQENGQTDGQTRRAPPAQHLPVPLPIKNGVAPSYLWLPPGQWPDLMTFLLARYPAISQMQWQSRIEKGELVDQSGRALHAGSAYQVGMRIFYYREIEAETPIPFTEQVLYQDEHIVVVDKPHFLPVIPSGRFLQESLLVRLKKTLGIADLAPLHRLDRETAGVVVFSCNEKTRGQFQVLFQQRAVEKTYEALAPHMPHAPIFPFVYESRIVKGEPFFRMKEETGIPNAQTHIHLLASFGELALYQLQPVTGRTHQIRVHLAALGAPIMNDGFYPDALPCKGDDFTQPLQLLARSISFVDPLSGVRREFVSARSLMLPDAKAF